MITSGSANVVKYFYLFFFRAKKVGCEVRRCARQRREKITTIKGSGNSEDLWSWILFRGCANHSGFIPEKARRPVKSSAELLFFFWDNAATLLLCVAFQSEGAHVCSLMCLPVFFFIYVNTYTSWLQKKLAAAGPGSPHQFLFLCSSLHSTLRHLKIEKGTNLA